MTISIGIGVNRARGAQYNSLAADYFARVLSNGDSSLTTAQKNTLNNKFAALQSVGYDTKIDRLFAEKYCYTSIQALTPFLWNGIGLGIATALGSPSFSSGTGWTYNGAAYINLQYNPVANGSNYSLNNAGICALVNIPIPTSAVLLPFGSSDLINLIESVLSNFTTFNRMNTTISSQVTYPGLPNPVTSISVTKLATLLTAKYNALSGTATFLSTSIPNLNVYYGCLNNNGTASNYLTTGLITQAIAIGDSTIDKDILATALAA